MTPRRGSQSGATAVETALVLPVFLIMLLGIFNLGWGLYCGAEVRHAVERATRLLLADPATSQGVIQTAVRNQLNAADPDSVTVNLSEVEVSAARMARLTWTYRYEIELPFIGTTPLSFNSSLMVPLRG